MRTRILRFPARRAGALIGWSLLVGALLAQQPLPPAPPPAPAAEDRPDLFVHVTNVQVPVIVRDRNGNFINGLSDIDFQLIDGNEVQPIKLDLTEHPVSLVIAIQADRTAGYILRDIQKSASLFAPLVAGDAGEVAVLAFDHRIQTLTPFTTDASAIKKAFSSLKAGSDQHHLDDTAMEAVNLLRNRGKDRKKVLILISETRDKGSSFTARDVLTNAEFSGVEIYAIEMNHYLNQLTSKSLPNRPNPIPPEGRAPLPMGNLATPTTDAQTSMGNVVPLFTELFTLVKGIFIDNSLEVYTKFTGGRESSFVSMAGLEDAVDRISEEMHSQYVLTFPPTNKRGGYHEITVSVLNHGTNLKVTTRPGFWYAPQAPDPKPAQK